MSFAVAGLLLGGCRKWEDHNALQDPLLDKDIFTLISGDANLSSFAGLLVKSGYDKVLTSSKTFTVFAPVNTALSALDPAIVNDTARLRLFVGSHIAGSLYYTSPAAAGQRIPMLNKKYHNVQGNNVEDAHITAADKYCKNGVLQVIDKMMPALPNTWEFVETNNLMPSAQKSYLLSIFANVFDVTNAVQIGYDSAGRPMYQPGTDSVRTNLFWRNVHDLRNEKKQYTFFALANSTWDAEVTKYKPFFVTGTADSTASLALWEVVKDFAVDTLYSSSAAIPDTILSKFNTKMGIEKSAVVQTVRTSNGIVYIMSKLDVLPRHKFKPIQIEAENYSFTSADRRGNTYFRDRVNTLTGAGFRDVLVWNHGLALFNLGYRINGMPSLKYRAYWVAVHDNINGLTTTFTQKLGIGIPNSTVFGFTTVNLNNYQEVLIGEFTLATYQPQYNIYLTAANNTTAATNAIVCDYIRLEPVL